LELARGLISVDDHVQEHPEVWTSRLSRETWGDRIPRVERDADGSEHWLVDGRRLPLAGVASAGALTADPGRPIRRWADVPEAAYVPAQRLRAMDADGVGYSVLYPTVAGVGGETFARITDPELELACVRAYNDWLIEEWAAASPRFIPQCIVPLFPAEAAVAEIRRAIAMGHRGVIYPAVPMELRDVPHVNEPDYDPIWAACADLGVPLCIHAGSSQVVQYAIDETFAPAMAEAFAAVTRPASSMAVLVHLLISQILMRHPRLRVVLAESSLGWGPNQLEFVDQQFREDGLAREGYDVKPSDLFRRQCYLVGWHGKAGLRLRRLIGVDNMLWATNFPQTTSLWPRTQEQIAVSFADVPDDERARILWRNAAELYQLAETG
jgi:predicted TIM-barrel fold metal-dependent hydrolase